MSSDFDSTVIDYNVIIYEKIASIKASYALIQII